MSRILWKSLLLSPAILGVSLAVTSSAMAVTGAVTAQVRQPEVAQTEAPAINSSGVVAQLKAASLKAESPAEQLVASKPEALTLAQATETPTQAPAVTPITPVESSPASNSVDQLDEVNRYSNEGKANNLQAQVTSVSQLSDVQPTDWAFQALQSLVERYGCIAGYPDGTYRGNRALTRYEFAAGLNACLNRVNELIAAASADGIRKEDLATLQRLQEEFAAELATLRGRVDALEAQTAELEANQFSTTTKLVGEVVAAVTDTFGDNVEDNTVLQERVRLDFQTSFFGQDTLHVRLATSNAQLFGFNNYTDANNAAFRTFEGQQTFNVAPNTDNDVVIDWAAYQFPLGIGESQGYIAAAGGIWSDFVATVNPYFEDYDGGRGALSTFASENPIYRIGGGSGAGVTLAFGEGGSVLRPSSLTFGYLADNAANPGEGFGLGNGDYAALGQLNFNIGQSLALAATYVHGYHNPGDGIFDIGGSLGTNDRANGPVVGTTLANNPASLIGQNVPIVTNSYGVEAAFRLNERISLSAFGTYTDAILIGRGGAEIWTFGGGVAFPDLGKEGNLLGIFAGIEPTLTGLDVPGNPTFSNDYGLHIEGFYRYQLTDNIAITPGVIWLEAPGQAAGDQGDADDVFIGTLRTTFTF